MKGWTGGMRAAKGDPTLRESKQEERRGRRKGESRDDDDGEMEGLIIGSRARDGWVAVSWWQQAVEEEEEARRKRRRGGRWWLW